MGLCSSLMFDQCSLIDHCLSCSDEIVLIFHAIFEFHCIVVLVIILIYAYIILVLAMMHRAQPCY